MNGGSHRLDEFHCKRTTDGRPADAECRGDGVETPPLFTHRAGEFGAFGGHDGGPAAVSALAASSFEAGVGAFDNHAAFHLSEGGHDVEEEFAACDGGVESFGEGTERDAAFAEVMDGVDDVANGSSEAIEFPDNEDVAVVLAEVIQAFGELGALRFGAGFVVGEDADRAGLSECMFLQFGVLLEGGDACVSDDAHSLGPSSLLPSCGMVRLFMSWWSTSGLQWV